MKRKFIMSTVLSLIIILSMSVGAFAATNLEQISVYLNKGLSFKLNGQEWQPKDTDGTALYPLTHNGSTYLPARAMAEALNVKIGYDGDTNTVIIGEAGQPADNKAPGTARSNPAPVGQQTNFTVSDFSNEYSGTLSVDQVIRGEEAWKMISSANSFNDAAKDGYEYMLAKITIKVNSSKEKDKQIDVSPVNFTLVSSEGKDYERVSIVEPDPGIRTNLYAGASHTGWAVFSVKKDDQNPVITYGRKYDGSGGVWFSTK